MISEKQLEANRENANKSTGPTTAAGKERSRLNACRHGLTGQVTVLPEEDREAYDKFTHEIAESLNTANPLERQLAFSYASFQWRINRAAALEENLFTIGNIIGVAENFQLENPQVHNAISNAKTFRNDTQEFARLALYSGRLVNQAEKVLKQLKQLQAERQNREHSEMAECVEIYKARRLQGLPFDPQANGFVLSLAQLEAHLRRQRLANQDFIAEEAARDRKKAA